MPFQKLPDGRGMVYIPPCQNKEKKHPCPDCFSCLNCADDRCRLCRGTRKCPAGGGVKKEKKQSE